MNSKTTKASKNAPSEKCLQPIQLFPATGLATTRFKNLANCPHPFNCQPQTTRNNHSNGAKHFQNGFGKFQNTFKPNPDCPASQRTFQLRRINPFPQKSTEVSQENQNCETSSFLRPSVGKSKLAFSRPNFEQKRKNSQLTLSKTPKDSDLDHSETAEHSNLQRNTRSQLAIGVPIFSKISCSLFPASKLLRKKSELLPTCETLSDASENPFNRKLSNFISSKSSLTDTENQFTFSPELSLSEKETPISQLSVCLKNAVERLRDTQNSYGIQTLSVFRKPVFSNRKPHFTIDFITKVVDRMDLRERVLFLAIELFYFSRKIKSLEKIEPTLLGLSAIWVAAKFEDAWAPHSNPFFKLDSVKEVKHKLIEIESQILFALNFNLNLVLVYDYFCIFSFLGGLPKQAHCLGLYLLNSTLAVDSFQHSDKYTTAFAICQVVVTFLNLPVFWNNHLAGNKKIVGLKIDDQLFRAFQRGANLQNIAFDFVFEKENVEELVDEFQKTLKSILAKNNDTFVARYQRDIFAGVSQLKLI